MTRSPRAHDTALTIRASVDRPRTGQTIDGKSVRRATAGPSKAGAWRWSRTRTTPLHSSSSSATSWRGPAGLPRPPPTHAHSRGHPRLTARSGDSRITGSRPSRGHTEKSGPRLDRIRRSGRGCRLSGGGAARFHGSCAGTRRGLSLDSASGSCATPGFAAAPRSTARQGPPGSCDGPLFVTGGSACSADSVPGASLRGGQGHIVFGGTSRPTPSSTSRRSTNGEYGSPAITGRASEPALALSS